MKYLTYNQWKRLGMCVKKGEKSTHRNEDGVATFGEDQVCDPTDKSYAGVFSSRPDIDDSVWGNIADFDGPAFGCFSD